MEMDLSSVLLICVRMPYNASLCKITALYSKVLSS